VGGFVDYGANASSWVQWSVPQSNSGYYQLEFRYANAGGNRPLALTVNGLALGKLSFPSTGSWSTWRTATVILPLDAASNTIRATATVTAGGPNVDYLKVTASSRTFNGTLPAPGVTNTNAGARVDALIRNDSAHRSAAAYNNVINQFAAGVNPRYAVRDLNGDGNLDTFCNILLWDVTAAMNAEIPHFFANDELNANETYDWMRNTGVVSYGWREATAQEAQTAANRGQVAVALRKNLTGESGHAMVIRPGAETVGVRGPAIAQAGGKKVNGVLVANNFNFGYVADSGLSLTNPYLKYYIHA
jgi:hypothetical protein